MVVEMKMTYSSELQKMDMCTESVMNVWTSYGEIDVDVVKETCTKAAEDAG
ncbi:hypothetical protein [Paenibacillus aestuarii]|uniref:Uncharacterized protein n=1 Tax=Paenibacillus aestuarii TaxID=516965 RepID=A0ABW0KC03_9BACL|nr:hypothetical protein [Paenibacillus aestuarii]